MDATYEGLLNVARKKWRVLATPIFLLWFTFLLQPRKIAISFSSTATTSVALSAAHLHLLIPANNKDENLCKTVLSAAIAGWPTPTLINWGATLNKRELVAGGSHIAKISGVLSYLRKLGPEHDDDLVLLVDGYDVWFQLRPSTLISRYHAINEQANARIRKSMGHRAFEHEKIEQTIVFLAQKRCWPRKDHGAPSLARKMFQNNPYLKSRQPYLDAGNTMGRVDSIRALFDHAMEKAVENENFGSDEKFFMGIFEDQEVQRGLMRGRHQSLVQRWIEFWKEPSKVQLKEGQPDEFGIGLDYASLLGLPTGFCEEDAAWIVHNDTKGIDRWSKELGTPRSSVGRLADDIIESQPPFRVATPLPGSSLPIETTWANVPLFTNMWTGIVPGLIHHNAHPDRLKSRRRTWWNETWFFGHARALYESNAAGPLGPVAVIVNNRAETAWWSSISDKGGAQSDQEEWVVWNDICAEFDEEIFREL